MVALIPFTRWLVGTSLEILTASIVPLTVAATPFVARLIETSLKGVDHHILEAAAVQAAPVRKMASKWLLHLYHMRKCWNL